MDRDTLLINGRAGGERTDIFLDPLRSSRYAIEVRTYTITALYFIKKIIMLDWSAECNPYNEDSIPDSPVFDNEMWRMVTDPNKCYDDLHPYFPPSVSCFVYLGYILFFLPRSGRSGPLVRHCLQETYLTKHVTTLCPKRTALIRQAIKEYLYRVGGDSLIELI